jgi:hypothetical protein
MQCKAAAVSLTFISPQAVSEAAVNCWLKRDVNAKWVIWVKQAQMCLSGGAESLTPRPKESYNRVVAAAQPACLLQQHIGESTCMW